MTHFQLMQSGYFRTGFHMGFSHARLWVTTFQAGFRYSFDLGLLKGWSEAHGAIARAISKGLPPVVFEGPVEELREFARLRNSPHPSLARRSCFRIQAQPYFAQQPWAEEATEFRIHFVPWPPRKGHSESYLVARSLRAGWELIAR